MISLNPKQYKEFLLKNEDKIILIIGFILVAILSFGAGKLSDVYLGETPIIFQDAPKCNNAYRDAGSSNLENLYSEKIQSQVIGNKNSLIYHLPGGAFYDKISPANRVYFNSEKEAQKAGYRKAKN